MSQHTNTSRSVDLGFDTLSEIVKCKAPSDTELQKFIKEQLHSLQTEMLRHEEVTAENRKMHESNLSLKSQLEAQQQHSNQQDNQIKGYQQTEADHKARLEQLERDLNELKNVPPIDTSGLEQEILDLRQQSNRAEEDLRAANINVEKIKRERDTYKVIITKLIFIAVLTNSRATMKTSRRSCTTFKRSQL
jgi:chromosome segregation ATPase